MGICNQRGLDRMAADGRESGTAVREIVWGSVATQSLRSGCLIALMACGCGQSTAPAPSSVATPAAPTSVAAGNAPTPMTPEQLAQSQATNGQVAESEMAAAEPEPVEGSPEWNLQQIMNIRLLPFPSLEPTAEVAGGQAATAAATETATDADGKAITVSATTNDTAAIKQRMAQTREIRRERNQDVIKLSMNVIAQTAKDPSKEEAFNAAVHHLVDAHLQLALQGDEASIAALYDAAEAFYGKKPDSPAAAEAQLTLVNLANANAMRYAATEPRWLQEFSRHAQLYATRFPEEGPRAAPLLLAAGRSCELHGMVDEAKSCFALIQSKFPESPQAQQVSGILRRMSMLGQKIEFAGPTLDGNYVSVDEHVGKTVVIVYWATHATPFVEHAAALQKLSSKYKDYIQVLSVNLDSEEGPVDAFLEKSHLTWPVIFFVEQDKRGWNSPLAVHYGVTQLPTIWIVDPEGNVAATDLTPETLEAKLREVILKHRNSKTSAASKTPVNQ